MSAIEKPKLIHEEWVGSNVTLSIASPLTKEISLVTLNRSEFTEYMEWRSEIEDYDLSVVLTRLTDEDIEVLTTGISGEEWAALSDLEDAEPYEDALNEVKAGFDPVSIPNFLKE